MARRAIDARSGLERLIADAPVAIVATNLERRVTLWNPAAERLFGWKASEVLGAASPLVTAAPRPAFEETRNRLLAGETIIDLDVTLPCKDGGSAEVSVTTAAVFDEAGAMVGLAGYFVDLRARRLVEEEARTVSTMLAAVGEQTTDLVFIKDVEGRYTYVNPAGATYMGAPVEEILGKRPTDLFPPEHAEKTLERDRRVRATGKTETLLEPGFARGATYLTTVGPLPGPDGKPSGTFAIARDVTERTRVEEELRTSRRLLSLALESAAMGVWERDLGTLEGRWTPELERLYGLEPGTSGQSYEDFLALIHPEDRRRVEASTRAAAAGGRELSVEFRIVRPDGEVRWVTSHGRPVLEDDGKVTRYVGVTADVTDRRRDQEAVKQYADRLAALRKIEHGLLRADTLGGITRSALASLREMLGAARTSLSLVDVKTGDLRIVAVDEEVDHGVDLGRYPISAFGVFGEASVVGTVSTIEDFDALPDPPAAIAALRAAGLRSALGVPLMVEDHVIGVLGLAYRKPGPPCTAAEVASVCELADLLAIAVEHVRTSDELRRSRELFSNVIASAHEGIAVLDGDLRYVVWNPSLERISGVTAAQVLGKHPLEAFPFLDPERVASGQERALAGESVTMPDAAYGPPDTPHDIWIEATHTPLRRTGGEIAGVISIVRDITERKLAEIELRESEEGLRLALETGDMSVWDWNVVTGEVARSAGYEAAYASESGPLEPTVDAFHALIHPDDHERTLAAVDAMLEQDEPYHETFRLLHPSGRVSWFVDRGAVVERNGEGRALRAVGVGMNVSRMMEAQEGLRRLAERLAALGDLDRALLETKEFGQAIGVPLARVRRLTEAVRASVVAIDLEHGEDVLIASDADNPMPPGLHFPLSAELLDALRRGEPSFVTHVDEAPLPPALEELAKATGTRSLLSVPIRVAGELGATLNLSSGEPHAEFSEETIDIAREVAARLGVGLTRAKAEDELGVLAVELEARVVERTKEVDDARAEAERANAAKSEFLSRMSHELRTPLNAVLGFAHLLQMDGLSDAQRESVGQIDRAGRHLLELINEVLDIAGIEAGRLPLSPEPLDAGRLVVEALDLVAPIAADAGVVLVRPDPGDCWVLADRQRLLQVLLNVLANAVRYNRKGGRVEVSCVRTEKDTVHVAVRDTGPGIAPDELERIFQPFERLSLAAGTEGTGLGLAVARGLAEAMDGSLRCESTLGEGSTFTVELRASEHPALGEVSWQAGRDRGSPGVRILHIEDSPSSAELVRGVAGSVNWQLTTVATGEEGLALAAANPPDLVLLDLHLPGIGGEEVLAELRADERTFALPVVVLSANVLPETVERLMAAGASAYLTKPIEVDQLLEMVAEAVSRR